MKWSSFQWAAIALGSTIAANTADYLLGALLFSIIASICLVVAIVCAVGENDD